MKKMSWIEKLNNSLALAVSNEVRTKITEGSESLTSGSAPGTKARWVNAAMERMDSLIDEKTRIAVMERCSCDFEVRSNILYSIKTHGS